LHKPEKDNKMPEIRKWSQSIEDYLKAIYELTRGEEPISTTQIATQLEIAPASVTSMLKKLATQEPPLVVYTRHYGVKLTESGRDAALRIIRRHRLLEQFLLEYLGYAWDEIHEEAERLEHAISPLFEQRLADRLGEPDFDPHGDPIPRPDLTLPNSRVIPLKRLQAGQKAMIRRVQTSEPGLLRYLGERGIRPNATVEMLEQVQYDRTLHIRINREANEQVIGGELGDMILVEIR
jgi:DtxR family transcriptional regulator, Mn-dependent transcriptional regulator